MQRDRAYDGKKYCLRHFCQQGRRRFAEKVARLFRA